MAFIVVKGAYADQINLHVFEERDGENGADRWADRFNAAVPWQHEDDRARVEEIGLTRAGEVPDPIHPVVVDGKVVERGFYIEGC
ncbi:hypothetical protein [Amycolatopsis sp. NPDC059657]|uniref:hypothetical protein n=1 Tax=Amycolatopsis sp. NPDC059657 TaxID=3346899 RepID=UPI00366E4B1E